MTRPLAGEAEMLRRALRAAADLLSEARRCGDIGEMRRLVETAEERVCEALRGDGA